MHPESTAFHNKHRTQINRALKFIDRAENILVISHAVPDGDAIGSIIAFGAMLEALGKTPILVNKDGCPGNLLFLPGSEKVTKPGEIPAGSPQPDLCFILDTAVRHRIGNESEEIIPAGIPVINIDHHVSNPLYGDTAIVETTAAACGQIIFHLGEILGETYGKNLFSMDTFTAIHTAISTDTGCFRYGNTNKACHAITAAMMAAGLDTNELNNQLYGGNPLRRVMILREALDTMSLHHKNRIGTMSLNLAAQKKTKMQAGDHIGLIQTIRDIDTVQVAILFQSLGENSTRVSMRSKEDSIDVNALASTMGGGGHKQAAGIKIDKPLPLAKKEVIRKTKEWLQSLPS